MIIAARNTIPGSRADLRVAVLDDAGACNMIAATEKGLRQLGAQRRRREVQAAAKNADATML